MPDHVIAAAVAVVGLGFLLADAVRAWWTAPVVDAVERLIGKATDEGALVLDLFAGSGTTLVACDRCRSANAEAYRRWSAAKKAKIER